MNKCCALCAAVVLLLASASYAQDAEVPVASAEEASTGFSVEGAVMFPTSYVFRGYVIEEDHLLVQPELTLSYGMEVGDFVVTPWFNAWFNFTDAPAPGEPEWANEVDLTLGADIELPFDLTLGVSYIWYNSPANAFDDIHEVGLTLSHSDILNPSFGIYREISNQNGDENTYIELGVTPGFDVPNIDQLRLDFPVLLGLSPDEYYTDSGGDGEVFGYVSAGVAATWSFTENLSVIAGADYIQMLADSVEESNDGDEQQFVGHLTFGFSY